MRLTLLAHALLLTYSMVQSPTPTPAEDARQRLQQQRKLEQTDVSAVLAGMRTALRGAYFVTAVEDAKFEGGSTIEYWLDDDGEIRFSRRATRGPGTQDLEVTLDEVTSLPARLCAGRQTRDGRLAITYGYWKGSWQTAYGRVHTPTHEIDILWQLATAETIDDGMQTYRGRKVRVLAFRGQALFTHRFWVDVQTLRPVRYSFEALIDGKAGGAFETITYPPPVPIERPSGIRVPDCI